MEFFLDVDGVILDFEAAFVDFVRDEYLPDLPADYTLQSWELATDFNTLDIGKVWQNFVDSDQFTRLNLLVDTDSFNQLSDRHSVYLITNLAKPQNDSRRKNLERYQLRYKDLFLAGHHNFNDDSYPTKSAVISKLHHNGERMVFLDDHPRNCQDVKSAFGNSEVFLMSRPHNKGLEDPIWTRVDDWKDFLEKAM